MHFLDLNDDVLRHVFFYFHGKNALKLSLTCRHVYDLAIERVAAVILCDSGRDLRLAHRYMFFGPHPRIQYLESLTVQNTVYRNDALHPTITADSQLTPIGYNPNWSLIRLVLDMLMNAPRLRRVNLGLLHSIVEQDPDILDALIALPSLTTALFDTIGDTMVIRIRRLAPRVRHLYLKYHGNAMGALEVNKEPKTLIALLIMLVAMPLVQTLRIVGFDTDPVSLLQYAQRYRFPGLPHLPNLRSLMLWESQETTLDLVQLCPNLTSLDFSSLDCPDPALDAVSRQGRRWHPLRFFRLWDVTELGYVTSVLGQVHHFVIDHEVDLSDYVGDGPNLGEENYLPLLLTGVQAMSPVGMFLRLRLGAERLEPFWRAIAVAAPRLRFLELELSPKCYTRDVLGWLHLFPQSMRFLKDQLISIRIVLPRMVTYGGAKSRAMMRLLEPDRAQAARLLPQRLAQALPALRFVGVHEVGPFKVVPPEDQRCCDLGLDDEPEVDEEDEEMAEAEGAETTRGGEDSDDEPGENAEEALERNTMDFRLSARDDYNVGHTLYRRYWRVWPSLEDGPRLEEMSREQADRVQTFLESAADLEQLARVEEVFL